MKSKTSKKTQAKKSTGKHIVMLLDETGSMSSRLQETISGFNSYIEKAAKDFKDSRFTLMRFDSTKKDIVYDDVPLKTVGELKDYRPGAMTPLYDAIGALVKHAEKLSGKVFVVMITDGEENASHEFKKEQIFDIIKKKEADGWAFSYIGVHPNAWGEAQMIGIQACMTLQTNSVNKAYEFSNTTYRSYLGDDKNTKNTTSGT